MDHTSRQRCPRGTWWPFRIPSEVNRIQGSCTKKRRPGSLVMCDTDLVSKGGMGKQEAFSKVLACAAWEEKPNTLAEKSQGLRNLNYIQVNI